jgi:hypothetical protein
MAGVPDPSATSPVRRSVSLQRRPAAAVVLEDLDIRPVTSREPWTSGIEFLRFLSQHPLPAAPTPISRAVRVLRTAPYRGGRERSH